MQVCLYHNNNDKSEFMHGIYKVKDLLGTAASVEQMCFDLSFETSIILCCIVLLLQDIYQL